MPIFQGNYIPDGTNSICNFSSTAPNGFHWQKHQKHSCGMSSSRAFMPPSQPKVSSQAWPLNCLAGIIPCGSFIPQEQKNNKNHARKTLFDKERCSTAKEALFWMFFLCQQLGRQAAGEVKDRASSLLERHGFASTAYSHSELIDGKVFLLFLFVPTGK